MAAELTHAPLPTWAEVAAAAIPLSSDAFPEEVWTLGRSKAYWLSRSAWSLRLIAEFRQRVSGVPDVVAWFPDYFCNESLRPLRELGVRLVFYPVETDTRPDAAAIERLAREAPPDLVVAVHYFGQPFELESLTSLARDTGAWLIEDAAHVLRPVPGIGERGDFVLYSPHKLLPIPDGALLIARDRGPGALSREICARHRFDELYRAMIDDREGMTGRGYSWLAKRSAQKLGARSPRYASASFADDVESDRRFISPHMTVVSRRLLSRCAGRLNDEGAARFANRDAWTRHVDGEPLPAADVPYLAGFAHATMRAAEDSFQRLQSSHLPAMTWPDLPREVRAHPERHHVAIAMRERRVFLPVHRSVTPRAIDLAFR